MICLKSVSQRIISKKAKSVLDMDNPYHVACLIPATLEDGKNTRRRRSILIDLYAVHAEEQPFEIVEYGDVRELSQPVLL